MNRSLIINAVLGFSIALIILVAAFISYSGYRGYPSEAGYKGYVSSPKQPTTNSFSIERRYSEASVAVLFINLSSNKYSSIELYPLSIKIFYLDGRELTFSENAFLSSKFNICKSPIPIAAFIVQEGLVDKIVLEAYVNTSNGISYKKIFEWDVNIEFKPGFSQSIYLTIQI